MSRKQNKIKLKINKSLIFVNFLFFKNIKTKYCHVEFSIRSLAILANASTIFSAAIRALVPMAILELIVKYVIRNKKTQKKQNQPNSNSFII